jgi:Methyl-accepting chemotaxis protein (MCP) signalling domain
MLAAATRTFQLFCDSHAELMRTVKLMDPAHMQRIMQTYNGPQGVGPVIERFMQRARTALNDIERSSPQRTRALSELVATADDVLDALNVATSAFDQIARHNETELVTDIQSVAREAKVVSFNAQVIAARAGEQGRGFSVVANVLSDITHEIDRQSKRAMELTRKSRLAA